MITRRRWHLSALAAVALLVAACGGGDTDAPLASRVIAFGDSLTDVGTYVVATSINGPGTGAPFFGGKFTTNSHTGYTATSNTSTANIWVEWIAARLGVVITQAEVGFATTRIPCPAAASGLADSCTGYAQGGSRVTDPNGIGKTGGALTIPIADQIASHNTRTVPGFTAGFGKDDIVFVFGGNNDVFTQLAAAAQIGPEAATANVVAAATELATLVKEQIIAKGAKKVAVVTLPDSSATPFGAQVEALQGAQTRAFLQSLSAAFNTALIAGLEGSRAKIIDARAMNAAVQASPATYGITNITTPACNADIIAAVTGGAVTNGSSLFCNAAPEALFTAAGLPSLNAITPGASASSYLFADGVHPTTGAHKIFADQVWAKLKDFGWVPDNL
jgi:outer membrane lipase/esterase